MSDDVKPLIPGIDSSSCSHIWNSWFYCKSELVPHELLNNLLRFVNSVRVSINRSYWYANDLAERHWKSVGYLRCAGFSSIEAQAWECSGAHRVLLRWPTAGACIRVCHHGVSSWHSTWWVDPYQWPFPVPLSILNVHFGTSESLSFYL